MSSAALADTGKRTAVTRTEAGNDYYAGGELTIDAPVQGDLFAAGGRVTILRPVGADAALAGGSVEIRSTVGQDLRVAGGNVVLDAAVEGELAAVGGTVTLVDGAAVSGSAMLSGGEVVVDGRLGKGARIYANRIVFNGEIEGDARFYARDIVLGPRARIDGNLYYASQDSLAEEQLSKISGRVVRERTPDSWKRSAAQSERSSWFHPLFFVSMLASGFILYLLFPNAMSGVAAGIAAAPWRSILTGLALLFTLPPVALLLMLTLVGLPLGLGLFMLYPILLMLGYLAAAFVISRKLGSLARQPAQWSKGRQAVFLALALLVLALAGVVPFIGWVFVFLSLTAGIGGWGRWLTRQYRASRSDASVVPTPDHDTPRTQHRPPL